MHNKAKRCCGFLGSLNLLSLPALYQGQWPKILIQNLWSRVESGLFGGAFSASLLTFRKRCFHGGLFLPASLLQSSSCVSNCDLCGFTSVKCFCVNQGPACAVPGANPSCLSRNPLNNLVRIFTSSSHVTCQASARAGYVLIF